MNILRALGSLVVSRGHEIRIEETTNLVEVAYRGTLIASTERPVLLHETGLPTRYYIRPEDVRMELLAPTEKHTVCPFKGTASYWSARVGEEALPDVAWCYPEPIPAAAEITGLVCFYNERVNIEVHGNRTH